jgi:hypothetical protein
LSFVYFTDRSLGKKFPDILRSAGLTVERHADHFDPQTPDSVWLETVGMRGWVAITHDQRIRYKPNERDAVIERGVGLLVVIGKAPLPDLASSFVATLPRIERFIARHEPPFIAKVYRPSPRDLGRDRQAPGRIELWFPR